MKYRKKPVVIEAVKFTHESCDEVQKFVGMPLPIGIENGKATEIVISTLEGNMIAKSGDWIIRGVNGEFYPCKPDIFEKTYEKVES